MSLYGDQTLEPCSHANFHSVLEWTVLRDGKIDKYTRNLSRAKRHAKSLPHDVTHVMNFTRLSACIIEKLGGAWVRGYKFY